MSLDDLKPTIYITGAGPGDPGLLTLKAKEIIEKADVIAYDNLVSKEILEYAISVNKNTKGTYCSKPLLVYVGKIGGEHEKSLNQDQINKLILELSKEYKIICRLKGGDPNIFGRGGEEAIFLKENNINFEVIPGVSSISSVPAYAGIPITHRDCNSSFTVITAHEDPNSPESKIKWDNFDAINNTLVLLMGVKYLPQIIEKLISLGRSKDTPLAIIYSGTTSKQKTITTILANAIDEIKTNGIKAPSIIVIGEVVNYRSVLNWFESKPLFGKRILITRSKEQSFSFASQLIQRGAKPINCPTVSYSLNEKELYNKSIINNISNFDWILFTSQNAVRFFFESLDRNCYDARVMSKCQIAVVGYKTKLELEKYNIKADFVPKKFSFQDLLNELNEKEYLQDKKILYPTQVEICQGMSLSNLTTWPIYNANFVEELNEQIISEIKEGIDIITFFSSNTAKHFYKLIEKYNFVEACRGKPLYAVIGQETANTVKQLFGHVDIIAESSTEEGLINSMEKYFAVETLPVTSLLYKK